MKVLTIISSALGITILCETKCEAVETLVCMSLRPRSVGRAEVSGQRVHMTCVMMSHHPAPPLPRPLNSLDCLLCKGLMLHHVVEVVGRSSVGKTQACFDYYCYGCCVSSFFAF